MQIKSIHINNFKSIRELELIDIENALILVGKNNTGKTVVLDAIRAVTGDYAVRDTDFNEKKQNIEIGMVLEITEEDLRLFHGQGIVSNYKKFDSWKRDFGEKLPSYTEGNLHFVCTINQNGKIRYDDGTHKNNRYIPEVLPRLHFIDTTRNVAPLQEDLLMYQESEELSRLRSNACMFDSTKNCNHCFQCIGLINQKRPEELQVYETARLLEYKMYQLNLSRFAEKINENYRKNGGVEEIRCSLSCNMEELFSIRVEAWHEEAKHLSPVERLGNGMKSIYMLSLLETYIEDEKSIPSIIIVEYPELFLHPSLQKTASKILYRLSKKNQVIFTTHSPNMVANFTKGQICQMVLDVDGYSAARQNADIDDILTDLGYSANDFLNVDFVFIVEGRQDKSRLPLLLEKYYSEVHDKDGEMSRISIITTNSCTNIKTYANLKYMNQLYLRDQFLMIRDGDGKNPEELANQLCKYYSERNVQDIDRLPRVRRQNVLILKYYSFENYFLNPKVMAQLGIVESEEAFWETLFAKWQQYLYRIVSGQHLREVFGKDIESMEELKENFETFKIYMRGHNLYDIFYGRFREQENELLRKYLEIAPREDFADILDAIDAFEFFESRRKESDESSV
ncbi:MAG: AAA family ATPase [Lachnospiraceae bacterium]|nr:AAA family ATPase [Lachnospiraceae bacterium]